MRIIRRLLKRDAQGNALYERVEETRAGAQGTETDVEFTFQRCANCRKPLLGTEDVQPNCHYCHTQMCKDCKQFCEACKRGICYTCRSSFAPQSVSLCHLCVSSKRAVEEILIQLKLVEAEEIDLPGTLGTIARLAKNHKLHLLQKKLRKEI